MKQQWTSQVWGAALLVAAAAGCSSSDGTSTTNNGNTAAAGSSSSATAGAGTAAAGASGGSAGSAAGGAATGPFACGAKSTKAPAELYNAMAMAFLPQDMNNNLPCAFGSCHNASKKAAMLALPFGGNLVDILVDKPSCEVPTMKLVATGGGDTALKNSWLYNKLAAPVDGSASLIAEPAWGTAVQCGQMGGDFGQRMPISSGADGVGEAKLAIVKEWICNGAPGPM